MLTDRPQLLSFYTQFSKDFSHHYVAKQWRRHNPNPPLWATMAPHVIHPDLMLRRGLRLQGFSNVQINRLSKKSKIDQFKGDYGRHPIHISRLWRDLQLVEIEAAKLSEEEARKPETIVHFFWALYFLKVYPKEKEGSSAWNKNRKTLREGYWPFVHKISAMAKYKIVWPTDEEWRSVFIISVDGTDEPIQEPRDKKYRKNKKWFSKKMKRAGLGYELALHLFENKIVHAAVYKAKTHDLQKFRRKLMFKIPEGKRVVADRGYWSKDLMHILATPNPLDTDEVKEFKKTARARQEHLNSRLANYNCVAHLFRHGVEKHTVCFMACLVMIQYAIEDTGHDSGEPLNSL